MINFKIINKDKILLILVSICFLSTEQSLTFNQFIRFGRSSLEKLFEIGSFSHTRELGREVEFIDNFEIWKTKNNSQTNVHLPHTTKQLINSNYVSFFLV